MSRICVAVRKRPCDTDKDIVTTQSPQCVVNEPRVKYDLTPYTEKHTFVFDEVLDETVGNREVYHRCCKPLIDTVFSFGNATCFAYGQTGSGKTHTMLGRDSEPGLYACAAMDVFARCKQENAEVFASFYEIYGRKLFDLINDRAKLVAREDAEKVINICGLSEHSVSGIEDLLQMIQRGSAYRAAGITSANAESSRSHAVLQLEVREKGSSKAIGRISFIDLAGNERGADTFDCDRKTRMEGAEINKSLLALKECIRALGMGKSHVPFRGSVLTEVLRDSFLGNSRTTMIATISPSSQHCENTLNTLRYTQRVKDFSGVGLPGPSNNGNNNGGGGGAAAITGGGVDREQRGGAGRGGALSDPTSTAATAAKAGRRKQSDGGGGGGPAGAPLKRPEWIDDYSSNVAEPVDLGQQPTGDVGKLGHAVSGAPSTSARRKDSDTTANTRTGPGKPWVSTGATPRIAAIKDPKIATIVMNHLKDMEPDDMELLGGGSGEDDDELVVPSQPTALPSQQLPHQLPYAPTAAADAGGGPMPLGGLQRSEAKQVRAVHAHVVREISKAEENIMSIHRRHIDVKMNGVREEIRAIQALEEQDTVDEYVTKVASLLTKQRREIDTILEQLGKLQGMLKEEEELSRTLTPMVKPGGGRRR